MEKLKILIINNYGQTCHLIHRSLRDLGMDAKLVPNTSSVEDILKAAPDGLVFSGGPTMDRVGNGEQLIRIDLPILGICLGHQLMAKTYGGEIRTGHLGGFARIDIEVLEEDDILKGMAPKTVVWASHQDEVAKLPPEFIQLARSNVCEIEAMKHKTKPLYGVQWHPEVSHTEKGIDLLKNFLEVCSSHK
ncbi:GMP synthase [Methanocella sp. CWC-04]|uniref:GMP synthase [glutamine-hydrolyzing] subunit A n=1 Tax=Methanooceanicella nereidis TaxID=2052831 RepID=A0AAP2REM5_9EURY|nr:GMP synthase subunit A [Methanocella sp. CWC-04]MCD1296236.1 GMP synthase [Methanocella sp. CWC-04]